MIDNPVPGRLLSCPNCETLGKKQILGKVLDTGDLLVLRFHHGTTLFRTTQYSLICGCGYGFDISGTVVTNMIPITI